MRCSWRTLISARSCATRDQHTPSTRIRAQRTISLILTLTLDNTDTASNAFSFAFSFAKRSEDSRNRWLLSQGALFYQAT